MSMAAITSWECRRPKTSDGPLTGLGGLCSPCASLAPLSRFSPGLSHEIAMLFGDPWGHGPKRHLSTANPATGPIRGPRPPRRTLGRLGETGARHHRARGDLAGQGPGAPGA